MLSLSHTGLHYRTKPMDPARANQFAKCLAAHPAFTAVEVQSSRSPGKAVVAYQPKSEQRLQAMRDTVQNQREERAASEGAGYVWLREPGFHWCMSLSGEVYEVTPHSCTCADHVYRCKDAGLACKHQVALGRRVGTFLEAAPIIPAPDAERAARIENAMRRMSRDFPVED